MDQYVLKKATFSIEISNTTPFCDLTTLCDLCWIRSKEEVKKNLGVKSRVTFPIKYTQEFTVYILESILLFSFGTFDSFLTGPGRN